MADAIPVNPQEEATPGISSDVQAELKAQAKSRAKSIKVPAPEDPYERPFKVAGGAQLQSHDAVREDN